MVDPDPGLATRVLSVNVHGVVRPTIATSSRALGRTPCDAVREVHPRPEPPPTRLLHERVITRRRRRAPTRLDRNPERRRFIRASLGLRLHYRSLQRMFDARARPRAVNPPPREAPASVRVRLHARLPAREGSPGGCPPARPLPVAPTHCLRSLYRPDDLHHPLDTGERATSFSRHGCLHPCEFCPTGARAETAFVRDEHDRILRRS